MMGTSLKHQSVEIGLGVHCWVLGISLLLEVWDQPRVSTARDCCLWCENNFYNLHCREGMAGANPALGSCSDLGILCLTPSELQLGLADPDLDLDPQLTP